MPKFKFNKKVILIVAGVFVLIATIEFASVVNSIKAFKEPHLQDLLKDNE